MALSKAMANVADEARGQRAMIHLMLDEVPPARDLVDGIQLSRHQDAKSRFAQAHRPFEHRLEHWR